MKQHKKVRITKGCDCKICRPCLLKFVRILLNKKSKLSNQIDKKLLKELSEVKE